MSVKAFELVPAIEREHFDVRGKTEIECIECCGKNVYIGTDNCFVFHFILEEGTSMGRHHFTCLKQGYVFLHLKKPISQLKAASALNSILVLCDGNLTMLNMIDLKQSVTGSKVRGVTCFSVNENPSASNPFSIEVCAATRKKSIQVFTVTDERIIPVKDISIGEPAVALSFDGSFICYATSSEYFIVNIETGFKQDLFPYANDHGTVPIIARMTKEEFLLNGPNALGMFVTTAGISQHPPLQWNEGVESICYEHPYVLALNDEFITVHNITDQQQKQTLPFQRGRHLGEFDGKLFVTTRHEVYALVPVAWEKQIQALLGDQRVNEALELAKNYPNVGMPKDKFQIVYQRIQQQAGFIEFSVGHLDEAKDLFIEGNIDVRELLSLYPSILPTNSNFTRSVPELHHIANVDQLSRDNPEQLKEYKEFLVDFLERKRNFSSESDVETDTGLVKLYAELQNVDKLRELLESTCLCDYADCVASLSEYRCYHALALLYHQHDRNDKALSIWKRISDGEYEDHSFPGLEHIVNLLSNLGNPDLVWKYVDWVLEKNQEAGVKIFIDRPPTEAPADKMHPDSIIDYLHRFPKAVISYLEFLVFTKRSEKEKYHTHLAVLYLDLVLQLKRNKKASEDVLTKARGKLRYMLSESNLYRVQLILGKVKETDMYQECAILYGKLEEHEKAIRILVHKLRDFKAAEEYCITSSSGKEPSCKKRLFQVLLTVYLDPTYERRDLLVQPAVALLNSNKSSFDTLKVLQLIPDNWSINLLSQFLMCSVRHNMATLRTRHVQRGLERGENIGVKKALIEMRKTPVFMTEDSVCPVCQRGFNDSNFARYPNGTITHVQCAKNKFVCPVTGRIFRTTNKQNKPSEPGT